MIVKNKEILLQHWNSNKPMGYMSYLTNLGLSLKQLKKDTTCCGFIVAKDIKTKEVNVYVGMGLGIDEEEDITNVLELGEKLQKESCEKLIEILQSK